MSASPIAAAVANAPATSSMRKLRRSKSSATVLVRDRRCVVIASPGSTFQTPYRLRVKYRQPRFDGSLAVHLVDHVDTVVLLVRAGDAEEEGCPAPEPEPALTRERAPEDEFGAVTLVVHPLALAHSVHVDLDRTDGSDGKLHARLGHAHRMPASCAVRSWLWSPCSRSPSSRRPRR